MTDESQIPINTYAYDAFGRIRSETGELVMNRWTYTGREALGDSEGLYYYRWRVMDPNTGRFTSEDPLGFVDGPNVYSYTKNSPVCRLDPLGLNDRESAFTEEEADCLWRAEECYKNCIKDCRLLGTVGGGAAIGIGFIPLPGMPIVGAGGGLIIVYLEQKCEDRCNKDHTRDLMRCMKPACEIN